MARREPPTGGCVLCGATWGDYRATIEGEELSFCCDAGARVYAQAVRRTREATGWPRVDRLFVTESHGTFGECEARWGPEWVTVHVVGEADGSKIHEFRITSRGPPTG